MRISRIQHYLARLNKPLLIWLAPVILTVSGLMSLSFTVLAAMSTGGVLSVGDQPIPRSEWLVLVLPCSVLACAWQLSAAYGLLVERPWARELLVVGGLVLGLLMIAVIGSGTARLWPLVAASWSGWVWWAMLAWYFYRYAPVVAYYQRISQRR